MKYIQHGVLTKDTLSSRLYKNRDGVFGKYNTKCGPRNKSEGLNPQLFYAYTDEKITLGDVIIFTEPGLHYKTVSTYQLGKNPNDTYLTTGWKKVSITDDYMYDLPRPSTESLLKFTLANGGDVIFVPYSERQTVEFNNKNGLVISTTPKTNNQNVVDFKIVKQMYSTEEVDNLLLRLYQEASQPSDGFYADYPGGLEEWKSKNRNKME